MTYPAPATPDVDVDVETPEQDSDSGAMPDEQFQTVIRTLVTDAVDYVDGEITPARAKAAQYYQGLPFGNEEKGRSQFVLTVVRDVILAILPDLLRVFCGAQRAVEFTPHGPEDVAEAEQRTDYVNEIVLGADNPGFLIFHSWFHDALEKKLGAVKYWWDDTSNSRTYRADNLALPQLALLQNDPEIEILSQEALPWQTEHEGQAYPAYRIEYKQTRRDGRARVAALPPEEFLFSRDARSLEEATFVGHRTEKTRSELLAMGVPEDVIDAHGGTDATLKTSEEEAARRPGQITGDTVDTGDEATEPHLYVEGYAKIDRDGDGQAELRRVLMIGPNYHVFEDEPWDEVPFATLTPFPIPHVLLGNSSADLTMDLQLSESMIFRSMLDSLALAIHPRTWYVEGRVAVGDIMNPAIGTPIRMEQPGMAGEFTHSFVGKEALSVLEIFERVKEDRTGMSRASAGLDPDALQSSTKAAVAATITKAQARTEMIARIFAETGVKRLMQGLGRLLAAYQPQERMVRLRGSWVPVDPRAWDTNLDVTINVALGNGLVDEQIATLMAIAEKQELVIQTLGLDNPLVSLPQYRNTLAKLAALRGEKDASKYFTALPPDWKPPAPQQPPPDPAMLVAQAEVQKSQAEVQKKQAELQLQQQEQAARTAEAQAKLTESRRQADLQDDRERDKLEADIALRARELELKYQAEVDTARIRADMERDREAHRLAEARRPRRKITMSRDEATGDMTLAEDTIEETA